MTKKEKIKKSYNKIAQEYKEQRNKDLNQNKLIGELRSRLPEGSKILDAGCGSGIPVTKQLNQEYQVTGIDFSEKQIKLAKKEISNAEFRCEDLTQTMLQTKKYNAIISLFTLRHIPNKDQKSVLNKFYKALKSNGLLLITVGSVEWKGKNEDWLDTDIEMHWSQLGLKKSIKILEETGFKILQVENEQTEEEAPYILAKKQA